MTGQSQKRSFDQSSADNTDTGNITADATNDGNAPAVDYVNPVKKTRADNTVKIPVITWRNFDPKLLDLGPKIVDPKTNKVKTLTGGRQGAPILYDGRQGVTFQFGSMAYNEEYFCWAGPKYWDNGKQKFANVEGSDDLAPFNDGAEHDNGINPNMEFSMRDWDSADPTNYVAGDFKAMQAFRDRLIDILIERHTEFLPFAMTREQLEKSIRGPLQYDSASGYPPKITATLHMNKRPKLDGKGDELFIDRAVVKNMDRETVDPAEATNLICGQNTYNIFAVDFNMCYFKQASINYTPAITTICTKPQQKLVREADLV